MSAERSHLSLSMGGTLTASQGSQQPQPTAHVLQQQPASNTVVGTEGQDNSPGQTKRGPGRPKGSTKKSLETDPSSPPKLKRPVGRPRKDGRPAGSVPKVSRGPGRPRKNFPADFSVNTFPQQQQHQQQQTQNEQEGWNSLPGMFNNYRLPKEATSDASLTAAINETINAEQPNGPSEAPDTNSPAQQPSKWFPGPAANRAVASSSSIANALIHPPSTSQSAAQGHPAENMVATSSALVLTGTRELEKSANDVPPGPRPSGEPPLSIPIPQIPNFILATVYSLFSRPTHGTLPVPRDVFPAYRAHLGHLTGSFSIAYTFLKTFWLPSSPLLFRMVLPRSGPTPKSSNRNPSNRPSSSSRGAINGAHYTNGASDAQNPSRTSSQDQHHEAQRFFYWDPFYLSLSGPLTCPICNQASLTHCGSIRTGPLRVFDLPSSSTPATSAHAHAGLVPSIFYVIGMQYACSEGACGARLASWDSRIVNSLPQVLADEWPVQLVSVNEQNEGKVMGLSGDAVSRPLFTLVKTLAQAGTSQESIRDILLKLWDWSDGDRDDHGDETEEDPVDQDNNNNKTDNEKVAELLFSSPYQRLWTTQAVETSSNVSLTNDRRPAKRHKPNEPASGVATVMSAPAADYSSALFGSQNSVGTDGQRSSLAIQLQPPPEHHTNGVDHRSPRSQPQRLPHAQRSQGQLKPNPSVRPQPSPRTSIAHTHAHAPHIHTPSPIYPSTSLPNSTTNSPQTAQGTSLALKRPHEPETHHPPSGAGPPIPPGPAQAPQQTSPAQAQFPGLVHTSPFPHLRGLQLPGHPPQQPSHPPHHHPPAGIRPDAPLRMHSSLVHTSNPLAHFNPQTALHPMLATAPPNTQPQVPPPPPQHAPPQRRVRHCVKCGRHDCKGKGGSQFCKNPCKDCNGMDCKGRNSKRPNATCREGW